MDMMIVTLLKMAFTQIKNLAYKVGLIKDYVTAQGTSGIWTYRKWASGVAECWGQYTETKSPYTSTMGAFGYVTNNIAFPKSLFVAAPRPFVTVAVGTGFGVYGSDLDNTTKECTKVYAIGTASGSNKVVCKIHAIGTWK